MRYRTHSTQDYSFYWYISPPLPTHTHFHLINLQSHITFTTNYFSILTTSCTRDLLQNNGLRTHREHIAYVKLDKPVFVHFKWLQGLYGSATRPSIVCVHNVYALALQLMVLRPSPPVHVSKHGTEMRSLVRTIMINNLASARIHNIMHT